MYGAAAICTSQRAVSLPMIPLLQPEWIISQSTNYRSPQVRETGSSETAPRQEGPTTKPTVHEFITGVTTPSNPQTTCAEHAEADPQNGSTRTLTETTSD